jgi:hypothetical protein
MKKEIKFRFAFKVGDGVKFKFMSLDELLDCNFALEIMIAQINEDFGATHDEDIQEFECIAKDQFTGFKDINNVDIYENDLTTCHGAYYTLIKHIGGCYELHENDNNKVFFLFNHHKIISVETNAYENPELIKAL